MLNRPPAHTLAGGIEHADLVALCTPINADKPLDRWPVILGYFVLVI